jgi:deazaflavin-dependent oxidoreductase (nitroreductase family)
VVEDSPETEVRFEHFAAAELARVSAAKTVRLTTRGRRSGQPRSVTIWFVADAGAIGLGTLDEKRNWVRNARANPDVELEIGGTRFRGRLEDTGDAPAHDRVRRAMAAKYWPARILSWFGIGQRHTFRVDGLTLVDR